MLVTTTGEVLQLDLEERFSETQSVSNIFVVRGTTGRDVGFKALLDMMVEYGLKFYKSERKARTYGPCAPLDISFNTKSISSS